MSKLDCGCEEHAGTMGTMVRMGRYGFGHYAQDGDFMGECDFESAPDNIKLEAERDMWKARAIAFGKHLVRIREAVNE